AMLGDVPQPLLIEAVGGEVPADQIVVDRWTGLLPLPLPGSDDRRHDPGFRAQPPRGPVCHREPSIAGIVREQPIPELGLLLMGIPQSGDALLPEPFGRADRLPHPPVIRGTGELQYPTRD